MTSRINVAAAADIVYVAGASGSGKSSWVKSRIARVPRLVVWDAEAEYAGVVQTRTASDFLNAVTARVPRISLCPASCDPALFQFWCRVVLAKCGGYTAVAEETASVTHPGKAPGAWGDLVRRARKYKIAVIAITQRPSESDKTALGNATLIHCGRLTRDADRRHMAKEMNCSPDRLAALTGTQYIELDVNTGRLYTGDGRRGGRVGIKPPAKTT